MNLPIKFAQRYLFAKRSTNAINIISGITVFGLAVGTAALVIVFGVFNGLGELIRSMSSNFSPDVKVMPAKGKFFVLDDAKLAEIRAIDGVLAVSKTIEEIAFFEYNGKTTFGTLKGVDAEFHQVTAVDSSLWEGEYLLGEPKGNFALLGKGIRSKLDVNIDDPISNNLKVYMAKRKESLTKPFRTKLAVPRGVFSIEPEVDQTYVLSSLAFARKLMNYDEEVSFVEIKLKKGSTDSKTAEAIRTVMGDQFLVQDRYQQDEAFNKIMNVEKWTTVAITSLTLLIVAFNLIGALWMVVMDKRKDISILKSMGATDGLVRNIFLSEGLLLSMVGMFSGFVLALILYTLQKTIGIVPSPGFIVPHYPVELQFTDFGIVALIVSIVGLIASVGPAVMASKIPTIVREE